MTQVEALSAPPPGLESEPSPAIIGQLVSRVPTAGEPAPLSSQSARFRAETTREIFEMARYLLANGKDLAPSVAVVLQELEDGTEPRLTELTAAHFELAKLALPAKPIGISALNAASYEATLTSILGPTIGVRRLTVASLFFGVVFFAVSLSGRINTATMESSFLELSGSDLVLKHVILLSSAGLGATFGVLFSVWYDLAKRQFDPLSESAHWMRIGLGLVAGIVLSEIIITQPGIDLPFSGIVLALLGGFSAAFLHRAITRMLLKRAGVRFTSNEAADETRSTS